MLRQSELASQVWNRCGIGQALGWPEMGQIRALLTLIFIFFLTLTCLVNFTHCPATYIRDQDILPSPTLLEVSLGQQDPTGYTYSSMGDLSEKHGQLPPTADNAIKAHFWRGKKPSLHEKGLTLWKAACNSTASHSRARAHEGCVLTATLGMVGEEETSEGKKPRCHAVLQ